MTTTDYQSYYAFLSNAERSAAPKELFYEGDFSLLSEGIRVSVVGSRRVSNDGIKRTQRIAKALVERNIIVVSGLAEGVDTAAHTFAIENGGKTIAVLGTPLDKCSPVKNLGLLNQIKKDHLAISQFKEGSKVYPSNFPTRNKTMALISDATIIIEASENSGTRHQAWEAVRLGRSVMLLENVANDPDLTWAKELMNYGAIILNNKNFENIFDGLAEFSCAH